MCISLFIPPQLATSPSELEIRENLSFSSHKMTLGISGASEQECIKRKICQTTEQEGESAHLEGQRVNMLCPKEVMGQIHSGVTHRRTF